ncbi:MAG: SDR family NAD(P)-dependent oxidoreductase [Peptococcaceae bacterium]
MRLSHEVALITGAGQGIGRAIAYALAQEGAAVIINSRRADKAETVANELRARGSKAIAVQADVGDRGQAEALFERAIAEFGRVDILVNNAGISPKSQPGPRKSTIWEMDPVEWEHVVAVNLHSAFYLCRVAAPGMRERRHGFIINIASLAARIAVDRAGCHYCASKAGLISLTKTLSYELAPYGIRVNAVAPGSVRTEMTLTVPEEVNRKFLETVPMGMWGEPEDIAKAVLFLVTDQSRYITGLTLDVNGGIYMP